MRPCASSTPSRSGRSSCSGIPTRTPRRSRTDRARASPGRSRRHRLEAHRLHEQEGSPPRRRRPASGGRRISARRVRCGHKGRRRRAGDATWSMALDRQRRFTDHQGVRGRWEEEKLWQVRESGLGATANVPGMPPTSGLGGRAVPPDGVGDYLRDFRDLLDEFGYDAALYGHFGQGCIHCRIDFVLDTRPRRAQWRRFPRPGRRSRRLVRRIAVGRAR